MKKDNKVLSKISDVFSASLAGIFNAVALAVFAKPNNFIAGGFSGLSLILDTLLSPLMQSAFGIGDTAWLFYAVLNLPLLIFAIILLRGDYTLKTICCVIVSTVVLNVIEGKVVFNDSPIIGAIFGGIIMGIAMYVASVHNGSNGGTEVIAKIVNKKHPELDLSSVILVCDMSIMFTGCVLYIAMGVAQVWVLLYSVIYIFIGSKTLSILSKGFDRPQKFLIITEKCDELSQLIAEKFRRGFSVINVDNNAKKKIIVVVVQYRQVQALKRIITRCDNDAFSYVKEVDDVFSRPLFNRSYLK